MTLEIHGFVISARGDRFPNATYVHRSQSVRPPRLLPRSIIDPLCPGGVYTTEPPRTDDYRDRWVDISLSIDKTRYNFGASGRDKDSDNPAFRGAVIRARFRATVGLKRREEPEDVSPVDREADIGGERPIRRDLSYRIVPR